MPVTSSNALLPSALSQLIGTPKCPLIIDIRIDEDFTLYPKILPTSIRLSFREVEHWANRFQEQHTVIICQGGLKLSQGVCAYLRQIGQHSQFLKDGFAGWTQINAPLINPQAMPARNHKDHSLWVSHSNLTINQCASTWLIRRFIDRNADFLLVEQDQVLNVADRFSATAFDVEGAHFNHDRMLSSFERILTAFGLDSSALTKFVQHIHPILHDNVKKIEQTDLLSTLIKGISASHQDDYAYLDATIQFYDWLYSACIEQES
ncbi:MAG: chromate resistance protein ChrB domain-containing protein [Pseudomonadota bacterium]